MLKFISTFDPCVFVVSFEGMTIGSVGGIEGEWYISAEDVEIDIETSFPTKMQAAKALMAAIVGPKRATPKLKVVR